MQLNGWGESVPPADRVLQRDGVTRGPTACFATDFHAEYRKEVLQFVQDVGLAGIETDGQFEGIACSDETHNHNGLAGGWSAQLEATLNFNIALKELGVYQTGADGYAFSGAQRWNHADTDAFTLLPIWEQMTVGRLYTYDSTMTRVPTSGELGLGDLLPQLAAPLCDEHGGRLRCLDFILGTLYILAGQPYFHTGRLFDPADPDAAALAAIITRWTAFYKTYRNPRPSGAPGLLTAKMIHILRPSARALEAAVHVTSDTSEPARALIALINPTRRRLTQQLAVPLYYTGLRPGARVSVRALNMTYSSSGANSGAAATAPTAAAPRPLLATEQQAMAEVQTQGTAASLPSAVMHGSSATGEHVLGGDAGAGFTDIVLNVELAPASYAVLEVSVV